MTNGNPLPLAGIKVLELGHTIMGPTAGLVLADLGADVYKVERTGRGDDTRWLKGFGAGFFTYFNRNKRSLSIDLKSAPGQELLLRLIESADVLIENFGPETVERLGVGYETCRAATRASSTARSRASCPVPTKSGRRWTRSCR